MKEWTADDDRRMVLALIADCDQDAAHWAAELSRSFRKLLRNRALRGVNLKNRRAIERAIERAGCFRGELNCAYRHYCRCREQLAGVINAGRYFEQCARKIIKEPVR